MGAEALALVPASGVSADATAEAWAEGAALGGGTGSFVVTLALGEALVEADDLALGVDASSFEPHATAPAAAAAAVAVAKSACM